MPDYLGRERSESEIADLAVSWRTALGVNDQVEPNVLWCVETGLASLFPNFVLVPREDTYLQGEFAVAKNDPPRIELRDSVYSALSARHPRARFIGAHEMAHIVTQDQTLPKFLKDGEQERKLIKRMSLEHLADEFAQHFLAPEHIVQKMGSIGEIMFSCCVTYTLAVKAGLVVGIRPRRKLLPYEMIELEREETDDFNDFSEISRKIPVQF